MKRVNIYLTDKQIERLHQRAEKEGISMAELAIGHFSREKMKYRFSSTVLAEFASGAV